MESTASLEDQRTPCKVTRFDRTSDDNYKAFFQGMSPSWKAIAAFFTLLALICTALLVFIACEVTKSGNPTTAIYAAEGTTHQTDKTFPSAPLPLLWALPLEYFSQADFIAMQLGTGQQEMMRIAGVARDTDNTTTRITFMNGDRLIISPDVGVLVDTGANVLAKWDFSILWKSLYDIEVKREEGNMYTMDDRIQVVMQSYDKVLEQNDTIKSDLIAKVTPVSSSALVQETQSHAAEDLTTEDITTSFPLVATGTPTPKDALGLPSNVVSPEEDSRDSMLILSGMPIEGPNENIDVEDIAANIPPVVRNPTVKFSESLYGNFLGGRSNYTMGEPKAGDGIMGGGDNIETGGSQLGEEVSGPTNSTVSPANSTQPEKDANIDNTAVEYLQSINIDEDSNPSLPPKTTPLDSESTTGPKNSPVVARRLGAELLAEAAYLKDEILRKVLNTSDKAHASLLGLGGAYMPSQVPYGAYNNSYKPSPYAYPRESNYYGPNPYQDPYVSRGYNNYQAYPQNHSYPRTSYSGHSY